ncbi:MAG TPA: hypothetical protein VF092_14330, partial [Longimicrobium sp.]
MTSRHLVTTFAAAAVLAACAQTPQPAPAPAAGSAAAGQDDIGQRLARYRSVRLTTDLSKLTPNERRMIPLLIDAAREMDAIFWMQTYAGSRDSLMARITDARMRQYVDLNYGPWDRLENDQAFVPGVGAKPEGSNLYPRGMTKAEFDAEVARGGARADSLKGLYTLVRRDPAGRLMAVPYHVAFQEPLRRASARLREAAALAEDPGLRRYLELRAQALLTDDFQPSDLAWMDMKNNTLDIVIGPIETYEDALYGYKAANESYVLIKDQEWSRRLPQPRRRPLVLPAEGDAVRDRGEAPRPVAADEGVERAERVGARAPL